MGSLTPAWDAEVWPGCAASHIEHCLNGVGYGTPPTHTQAWCAGEGSSLRKAPAVLPAWNEQQPLSHAAHISSINLLGIPAQNTNICPTYLFLNTRHQLLLRRPHLSCQSALLPKLTDAPGGASSQRQLFLQWHQHNRQVVLKAQGLYLCKHVGHALDGCLVLRTALKHRAVPAPSLSERIFPNFLVFTILKFCLSGNQRCLR